MTRKFTTRPEAYKLLHEGAIALSEIEGHGIRVDKEYLESALNETEQQIRMGDEHLRTDPLFDQWRKRFGEKTNLWSHEQLSTFVFDVLKFPARKGKTESGDRESANEAAFTHIDLPFIKFWFSIQKIKKGRGTYLVGIQREMVRHTDGLWYVHPHFHLNTTITMRSSCSNPNFQNQPTRNQILAEMIRRCYIPRPGNQLMEIDYGQIEARLPCPYTQDPVLIEYMKDPTKDMHRDTACQIFMLKPKQVSKEARHVAKNDFVFPTFYGSYYAQCAPHIWEAIDMRKIKVEGTDILLRDHLRDKGITALGKCDPDVEPVAGTLEHHLREIERDFWGNRFKVYAQWKRDWWEEYQRNGGFMTLTGFANNLVLDRKQVCNSAIQGDAFACTLWSLPRVNQRLRRYRMKSRVIGEIHDCINLDGPPRERDDVIEICTEIMTQEITKEFTWLNVPLVVEPEVCPIDQAWFYKASLTKRGGTWEPSDLDKWNSKYGDWERQCVS